MSPPSPIERPATPRLAPERSAAGSIGASTVMRTSETHVETTRPSGVWSAAAMHGAMARWAAAGAARAESWLCQTAPTPLRRWAAFGLAVSATAIFQLGLRASSVPIRALALRVDPNRFGTWLRHAYVLRLLGRRAEGLDCMLRAERVLIGRDAGDAMGVHRLDGDDPAKIRRQRATEWARLSRSWVSYSNRGAAERAQARAVALAPERPGLWSGYAHVLWQRGDADGMVAAHRRALSANEDDAGAREALARSLSMLGHEASAAEMDRRFAPVAAVERERLARPPLILSADLAAAQNLPEPSAEEPPIVLDLTDLLHFVSSRRFVSGIQRVQAELALTLLRRSGPRRVYPALYDAKLGRWRLASPDAMVALILGLRKRSFFGRRKLDRLIAAARAGNSADFARLDGPVLFTPGATWADWRYLLSVREAKRRQGLRFVPFVHDCIPLILPETCSADVPTAYSRWLAGVSQLADAFVVNSKRTGADLRAMLALAVDEAPRVGVMPLDGRTAFARRPSRPNLGAATFDALKRRGFAICVGSIEPRKNHLLLFKAWRALVAQHGERAPMLVVVGRNGWREDDALAYLDSETRLASSVLVLPDVADAELAWFYERAKFSVCVSAYEGWGMPVTESLNAGLPVLAAHNSALIEAGGLAAEFFNSGDLSDLTRKIERLSFDAAALTAAKRRADAAPLREWKDLATDAMRVLNRVARSPLDPRTLAPALTPGRRYNFATRAFGADLVAQEAALHGQAWLGRDHGGVWSATGAPARLGLRVQGDAPISAVSLELIAPDRPVRLTATTRADGAEERRAIAELEPNASVEMSIPLDLAAADGERFIEIALETQDIDADAEIAARGVGVAAVTLVA